MDESLLARYVQNLKEQGLKYWNRRLHRNQTGTFLRWLDMEKLPVSQITSDVVMAYLKDRKARKNKHNTLLQALKCLRHFCRYLMTIKIIQGNPADGISVRWLDIPGGVEAYQGPLRRVLKDPYFLWKFQLPLFAPHWEPYIDHLADQSYTRHSLFHVLEHNFYFHRYLEKRSIRSLSRITPGLLRAYLHYRAVRFQEKYGRSLSPSYQRHIGSIITSFIYFAFQKMGKSFIKPLPKRESPVIPDSLLARYKDFCQSHKGLSPITGAAYEKHLLSLRRFLDQRKIRSLQSISLLDLDAFLIKEANRGLEPKSLGSIVTALRSFFGYLHLEGLTPGNISLGLMSPCRFSADLRPKYLPWDKIQQFLASIDQSRRAGKRDYAILTLLAWHGLRLREVAKLRIADINWNKRTLFLRQRKNNDSEEIPISPQAEEALRDYLAVRPPYAAPEIFLTAMAPIKALRSTSLCGVAQRHLEKFFGDLPCPKGAYLLRHSFAKALLDRGARLHEVGALLGHRQLRSTLIYTRIATEDMREVADNYAKLL